MNCVECRQIHLRFEILQGKEIIQTMPGYGALAINLDMKNTQLIGLCKKQKWKKNMKNTTKLLFGIHMHQPIDNFDWVIKHGVEVCYGPFLKL